MPSSQSSSICATNGSVKSSSSCKASSSKQNACDAMLPSLAPTDVGKDLSKARTFAYIADPVTSYTQSYYTSAEDSVRTHKKDMKARLDKFDAIMTKYR